MNEKNNEVISMIKEKLNVAEIERNATIATYGLDSLDVVEFLLDLEDRFNIAFESSETKGIKTVGELLDLIEKKLG